VDGGPVPRLQTARLVLRGWHASDIEAHAAMSADPEVMRYFGGPFDREESWRRMATHAGHWALRGYGMWAVEREADGALLGRVGLWNPEGHPGLEVGWHLARHAWGQGYAAEAARAAIDWAWTVLEAPRLISLIHPENAASIRLAERLGERLLRHDTLDDEPVAIFGIARPSA
jgi:RimJ/RimL family protein N-acetyltransferase